MLTVSAMKQLENQTGKTTEEQSQDIQKTEILKQVKIYRQNISKLMDRIDELNLKKITDETIKNADKIYKEANDSMIVICKWINTLMSNDSILTEEEQQDYLSALSTDNLKISVLAESLKQQIEGKKKEEDYFLFREHN